MGVVPELVALFRKRGEAGKGSARGRKNWQNRCGDAEHRRLELLLVVVVSS